MNDPLRYQRTSRTWAQLMGALAKYHSWRIIGAHHIPAEGGAVITCPHSLASYDLFVMGCASKGILGRQAYIVGDDLMFRIPGLEPVLYELGYVPRVSRERIVERLREGALIGIAPGGMEESLRSTSTHAYDFDWSTRRGFIWVAMLAGVPIVPIVCPRSNDIFTVYENPLTRWAYRRFKIPVPLFRGLGPTLVPRPIPLVSVVGEPLYPDVDPEEVQEADVHRMHERVIEATRTLSDWALTLSPAQVEQANPVGFPASLSHHGTP